MTFVTFRIGKTARLLRALTRHAADHGVGLVPLGHEERGWASATFAGVQLRVTIALDGPAADRWLAALPQAELPVRGAFVADLIVANRTASEATLAILLVDEG